MKVNAIKCDTCEKLIEIPECFIIRNDSEVISIVINRIDFDFCSLACASKRMLSFGITMTKE